MKTNNENENQKFEKKVKHAPPPAEPKAYPSEDMEGILDVVQAHVEHKFFVKQKNRIMNSRRSRVTQILGFNTTQEYDDKKESLKVQFTRAQSIVDYMLKEGHPPDPSEKKFAFLKKHSARTLAMLNDPNMQIFLDQTEFALQPYLVQRDLAKKELEHAVRQLPIYKYWIEPSNNPQRCGVGEGAIGHIIGELHDLADFGTVGKMWKYMGLAVIDGERQHYVKDAFEATQVQRYVGRRRAIVWNMECSIIKAQGARIRLDTDDKNKAPTGPRKNKGTSKYHYFRVYEDRKEYEIERHPELKEYDPKTKKGGARHIANRAQRYMGKRVLEDLWVAWHEVYDLAMPGTWEQQQKNVA